LVAQRARTKRKRNLSVVHRRELIKTKKNAAVFVSIAERIAQEGAGGQSTGQARDSTEQKINSTNRRVE
jgi:hypothetical protein